MTIIRFGDQTFQSLSALKRVKAETLLSIAG